MKTLSIKECYKCQTKWSAEKITVDTHECIEFLIIKIAYCPFCEDDFAKEITNTYNRRPIKKEQ